MNRPRSLLASVFLGCALLLPELGCGPHGECGCTPAPSASVQGRVTDAQGNPLSGLEVSAVQTTGSDPGHQGILLMGKSTTRPDGSFDLRATLGHLRILVRTQGGATVYLPGLGPDFELKTPGMALAGMDLVLTAARSSNLSVAITPIHGAQQEDNLIVEQILTVEGVEYTLPVANLKPAIVGDQEMAPFPNQPPGTYGVSLRRTETTGTHAQSGTAKATVALAEGVTLEVPLGVK